MISFIHYFEIMKEGIFITDFDFSADNQQHINSIHAEISTLGRCVSQQGTDFVTHQILSSSIDFYY